ncbi:hypothetical protein [Solidesulfovibrio sp. C21]|uniref:hypothetical protein n=1 Tax=Solidesulfovibrio sp. C21 TaxID=3398613 RepID=UPI0039FC66D9
MKATATKVLAGLVLFASGVVMGFFGSRYLAERGRLTLLHGDPRHFSEMVVRHMTEDLDLTSAQQKKLRPIVLDTADALAKVREEQEPQLNKIFEKSNEEIKKLLTPDQQEKFTALLQRLAQRRKAIGRFGPPPPPPGEFDGHRPPPPPPGGFDGHRPPPPGMGDYPPPPPPDFDGRSLDSPRQSPEGSRAPNATKPAPDAAKPVQPEKPDTSGKIALPAADK